MSTKARTITTAKPSRQAKFTSQTNLLTKAVLELLSVRGHFASRIQSQGQYHPTRGRWIKSKVRRGIGDIIACVDGRFVMIEIKYGPDKQSIFQKQVEKDVNKSSGYYLIVKNINDIIIFLSSFNEANYCNCKS